MAQTRRNAISSNDAIAVAVVAALSAVAAAFSDASPTGTNVTDIILVGALAAFVSWLGASAPWWALMTGAGFALAWRRCPTSRPRDGNFRRVRVDRLKIRDI